MCYDWRREYLFSECKFVSFLTTSLQDPNDDCLGAMAIGMQGFLVETGKYQPELYTQDSMPKVSGIFKDFSSVVDYLSAHIGQ